MNLRFLRLIGGIIFLLAGLWYAVGDWITQEPRPMPISLAGVVLALTGVYFLTRKVEPFEFFRCVAGGILGAVAVRLGASGVMMFLQPAEDAAGLSSNTLIQGGGLVIGGLAILLAYYYAFWMKSNVHRILENIFSVPELLGKLAFTLALLSIYRIGFHVPLPGLNQSALQMLMENQQRDTVFGEAMQYFSMFTGGSFQQSTLFGLGIMPYISASIIFMLLTNVIPSLERLQKEGPAGQKKIQEYTRYATVFLCIIQGVFWLRYMMSQTLPGGESIIIPEWSTGFRGTLVFLSGVAGLTGGTIFLMWLGEQIDEYGIGNGISLLIMAGIVVRLPGALQQLFSQAEFTLGATDGIGLEAILVLAALFVFVVAGAILITQGQRRIPIQQAKQMRGRRVYGGQRHYMPLRVNHGGVMPIIFASSLMLFPGVIVGWLGRRYPASPILQGMQDAFRSGAFVYTVLYIGLIFFFAYFWTTVNFRPKDMADQLRDMGNFIPGLRPGKRTAEYLERVMERITYCGAAFLAVIAVLPSVVAKILGIPFSISAFVGGTGLLIMVSVTLDLVQRIEANLVMRNYGGFLGGSARIKGPR